MKNILQEIVENKRKKVEERKKQYPFSQLEQQYSPSVKKDLFKKCLVQRKHAAVIAEYKRSSPSAGKIQDRDPAEVARIYQGAGAAAVSVITEEDYFKGSLNDIVSVRHAVSIPVLRKDFIFDRYQILESAAAGTDAVLLIEAVVGPVLMKELMSYAGACGLETLAEVHSLEELAEVLDAGASIIGINNRNLKDFSVDLSVTEKLAAHIPPGNVIVSESGIRNNEDMRRLNACGVNAILIGEYFLRSPDIKKTAEGLIKGSHSSQNSSGG